MDTPQEVRSAIRSRRLAWILMGLGGLLVLFLVFDAGFALGTRRGLEMRGDHQIGRQGPMFGFGGFGVAIPHSFIPDGHGAVGTIEQVSLPTLSIKTRDGDSEQVTLSPQTTIESPTTTLSQQDLHVGEEIVAVGDPNTATSTQLEAELIRILPPPPQQ